MVLENKVRDTILSKSPFTAISKYSVSRVFWDSIHQPGIPRSVLKREQAGQQAEIDIRVLTDPFQAKRTVRTSHSTSTILAFWFRLFQI